MLYSGNSRFLASKVSCRKSTMPPVVTMVLLTILVSFIVITRVLIHRTYEGDSIMTLSDNVLVSNNAQLNESEGEILATLWNVMDLSKATADGDTSNLIYYRSLREYLCESTVNLTREQLDNIKVKLVNLQEIINYEGQTDFAEMTLDGRRVAVYLYGQIYDICGLKLSIDMEGTINKITDNSGDNLYEYSITSHKPEVQVEALLITLSVVFILISICVVVAKKHQLFSKEVVYDGFDEEGFAQ